MIENFDKMRKILNVHEKSVRALSYLILNTWKILLYLRQAFLKSIFFNTSIQNIFYKSKLTNKIKLLIIS